jgi:uncharacterized protein YkwD
VLTALLPLPAAAQDAVPARPPVEEAPTAQAPPAPAVPITTPVLGNSFAAEMLAREAALIHQVNLFRREAGMLPLRWNRELSEASRWFARDAVITRPYCGHTDSLGRGPGARMRVFGYRDPITWGETIACGFTEPAAAVGAWMGSPDQRDLLLGPEMREAGAGYFYSAEEQRGYVVLKVSADPSFAPMVINDENPLTTNSTVELVIHPQVHNPVAMKVSNLPTLAGAQWEPFAARRSWTLSPGTGWKSVWVVTRDAVGRTTLLTDRIYLGTSLPLEELSLEQASNIGSVFAINAWPVTGQGASGVRLSMGWVLDGAPPALTVYRGLSQLIPSADAIGGSELRLIGGSREGYARGVMSGIPAGRILTAYFRLKVNDSRGSGEVARIQVKADGRLFGPVMIHADDFAAPHTWQEFGVTFGFASVNSLPQVDVEILRTGEPDVTVDAVRFFGQPLPVQSPLLWSAGSDSYRSVGVQARLDAGGAVGEVFDVSFFPVEDVSRYSATPNPLAAWPGSLIFDAESSDAAPQSTVVIVCPLGCADGAWQASSNVPWLQIEPMIEGFVATVSPGGLPKGVYDGLVTVTAVRPSAEPGAALAAAEQGGAAPTNIVPVMVPVRLLVDGAEAPELPPPAVVVRTTYLPLAHR